MGILSLILRGMFPVELISNWSDRLVGGLLIGIGLWALRKGLQIHAHPHQHHEKAHVHIHMHGAVSATTHEKLERHHHTHAPFAIGTLHGLAGSSHFLAIIPSLALPSNALAVSYLTAYGVGTVVAMMVFSTAVGSLAACFANAAGIYRRMMFACSAVAIVVGCCWICGFSF